MNRPRVKVCGITSPEDAVTVSASGVDAVGLVFYAPSSRYVSIDEAVRIARAAGPFVTLVGLFVNPAVSDVEAVLKRVPLHLLQFHGDETPQFCERFGRPYIKAFRVHPVTDTAENIMEKARAYVGASAILLDAFSDKAPGGTGTCFDWRCMPQSRDRHWILAGGLHPENIAEAVAATRPYAVDVSTGVESAPGKKDSEKVRRLMANISAIG